MLPLLFINEENGQQFKEYSQGHKASVKVLFLFVCLSVDRVSLCSHGLPRTYNVAQVNPKLLTTHRN